MNSISNMIPIGPQDESYHRGARRRATRYPLHADIVVRSPMRAEGVLLNASAGGLRVTLDHAVAEGEVLEVDVAFAEDRVARETAEVVWSRKLQDGWLAGLRFVQAQAS